RKETKVRGNQHHNTNKSMLVSTPGESGRFAPQRPAACQRPIRLFVRSFVRFVCFVCFVCLFVCLFVFFATWLVYSNEDAPEAKYYCHY
ncbi:MAG: hypothetical protein AAGJ35_13000, partial [Myxococcota bacterium]